MWWLCLPPKKGIILIGVHENRILGAEGILRVSAQIGQVDNLLRCLHSTVTRTVSSRRNTPHLTSPHPHQRHNSIMVEVTAELRAYLEAKDVHDLMDDMAADVLDNKPDDIHAYLCDWLQKDADGKTTSTPTPTPTTTAPTVTATPPPAKQAPPPPAPAPKPTPPAAPTPPTPAESTPAASPEKKKKEKQVKLREQNGFVEMYDLKKKLYFYQKDGKRLEENPDEMLNKPKKVDLRSHATEPWVERWNYEYSKLCYSRTDTKLTTWKIAETPFAEEG